MIISLFFCQDLSALSTRLHSLEERGASKTPSLIPDVDPNNGAIVRALSSAPAPARDMGSFSLPFSCHETAPSISMDDLSVDDDGLDSELPTASP